MRFEVLLNRAEQAKEFVAICEKQECGIDVKSGHYVVDGKSMLGVMSLNMDSPLSVELVSKNEDEIKKFEEALKAAGMLA